MIRFLADYSGWYGPLRVFDSITFRAMLAMAASFCFVVLLGRPFLRLLHRIRVTEDVDKPHSRTLHQLHAAKSGTPTMGGLLVVMAVAVSIVLMCDMTAPSLLLHGDIRDPGLLCRSLENADTRLPGTFAARVWERLPASEQAFVAQCAARKISPHEASRLADVMNGVLIEKDLVTAETGTALGLTEPIRAMVSRGTGRLLERNVRFINRSALEAAFPGVFTPRRWLNPLVVVGLAVLLAFGALGFSDDLVKLRKMGNQGLSKKQKLIVQAVFAGLAAWGISLCADPAYTTRLLVPFTKWSEVQPDLGILYYLFFAFVVVACSNAVNLTDGLDGLASGCTIMVFLPYTVLAYVVGNAVMCGYFRIPHVLGSGELTVYCAAMIGAVMGFLWFNAHPAKVFMGDTGSLALGASLAYVALVIKQELVLVIAGGVFVLEAASVLMQMVSFRMTGKRVFKCAPFHHHLEFSGWHENHVVVRLWIVGAILAGLALGTLKMH